MEPTFSGIEDDRENTAGDYVVVSKSSYKLGKQPAFGDIIVIDSRTHKTRTLKDEFAEHPLINIFLEKTQNYKWIKRVVGEAGDTIEMIDGKLFRNGLELEEDYIFEVMLGSMAAITVPKDHVFVLGDNRNHSGDSRIVGSIPIENVIGKVILRYYPFNKLARF